MRRIITKWLLFFVTSLGNAVKASEGILQDVIRKHQFFRKHKAIDFNARHLKMLEKLMEDWYGHLTTSKWAKINKCSSDTALRDIQVLLDANILEKAESGGRSTHYTFDYS